MKRLHRACTAFVLVSVFAATAWADDPPATPAPASTESPSPMAAPAMPAAPAARKFAGARTSYYISGSVSDSPFWTVGTTRAPGYSLAVGVNLNYDRNGLAIPGSAMRSTDKLSFQGLIYGSYYIYNKFPAGVAVEVAVIGPLSPSAFDFVSVRPGLVIYYAPFPAPVVIGAGLSLAITIPKADNAKATVQTLSPGLRIIYVFP